MDNSEIRKKNQLLIIRRYKRGDQQLPDSLMLGDSNLARVICLYTYAKYSGQEYFEQVADSVLENTLSLLPENEYQKVEHFDLYKLGCGLIYLLRNGFVAGDENLVLAEFDDKLQYWYLTGKIEQPELYGWIHYLRLRIENENCPDIRLSANKQNLLCLLSLLQKIDYTNEILIDDLHLIHNRKIFFEKTRILLDSSLTDNIQYIKNNKYGIDMNYVTFIIVVRIDSNERSKNLDMAINFLAQKSNVYIQILEVDFVQRYKLKFDAPYIEYRFVHDNAPVFYRAKYINALLKEAKTLVVCIWDIDMIIREEQLDKSISEIQNGNAAMSIPYDGHLYYLSSKDTIMYRMNQSIDYLESCKEKADYYSIRSVRGCYLVNRYIYLKSGGENIHLYGWGMDDVERVKRMEILGYPVFYAKGPSFHLYHQRQNMTGFYDPSWEAKNRNELLKVCSLSRNDLCLYVESWNSENRQVNKEVVVQSPFSQNYFCLIEKSNIAFVSIFKNGVTHLKALAVYSKTGYYPEDVNEAHDLIGYDETNGYLCLVSRIKDLEKKKGPLLKFAVWRDPIERLISNYKYFCLEGVYRRYFELVGLYKDTSFERFMEFVRFELGKSDPLYQDEHIRKQSDYYNKEDIDYIVPLNKLNLFLGEHGISLVKKTVNATSVDFELKDIDYITEIKELYKTDYDLVPNY